MNGVLDMLGLPTWISVIWVLCAGAALASALEIVALKRKRKIREARLRLLGHWREGVVYSLLPEDDPW